MLDDIRPSTIFLNPEGNIKLLPFGWNPDDLMQISKVSDWKNDKTSNHRNNGIISNMLKGFLAPELLEAI